MPSSIERAYVRQWAQTGRLLEEQRWREVATLSDETASRAADSLIRAALLVPLPDARRRWSGLVDLQDALHRRRP
jgi:hypothetical protein